MCGLTNPDMPAAWSDQRVSLKQDPSEWRARTVTGKA